MPQRHAKWRGYEQGTPNMKALFFSGLVALALGGCGGSSSNDCATLVNSCNAPPIANPGEAQAVLTGSTVKLDGSGSTDADKNPLTYSWSIVSKPAGSTVILSTPLNAVATFVPDLAGIYVITLTVNDGKASSAPVTTTVAASASNLSITQASFSGGSAIALRFGATAAGGSNTSPQLTIGDVPKATSRFAIIMDDENAPCQTGLSACRHWGVFNLPVAKTVISEGENLLTQPGTLYGLNLNGTTSYMGPSSSGHTYSLSVYALSNAAPFVTGTPAYTRAKFELDFKEYILGKATVTGVWP